jgi:hypothetical protein
MPLCMVPLRHHILQNYATLSNKGRLGLPSGCLNHSMALEGALLVQSPGRYIEDAEESLWVLGAIRKSYSLEV